MFSTSTSPLVEPGEKISKFAVFSPTGLNKYQYPNGYWRLEKSMDNGGWQGVDPSTMKPGGHSETHVPFPENGV